MRRLTDDHVERKHSRHRGSDPTQILIFVSIFCARGRHCHGITQNFAPPTPKGEPPGESNAITRRLYAAGIPRHPANPQHVRDGIGQIRPVQRIKVKFVQPVRL